MKRTSSSLLAVVAATAFASLTACGSDDSGPAAAPSAPPSAAPNAATTAVPAAAPAGSAAGSAAGTATSSCPSGAASSVPSPVTDASAARDTLLAAVCTASYGGSSADSVITTRWQQVAPSLTPGLFADSAATPTTIASSGSFLLDAGHTMDQLFAFAVTDGTRCAGGVAVIPQTPAGTASDTDTPTSFAPVDVASGQSCDAETVQNAYRPGSVHA